ncbi:alpha/beta hydrolase [Nonomuraea basaltis]|uniref:alpha/beta hydrolase n=1 Tax=Nonomuraea basaltis TaxID=2495887 RepID=UPI00110C58D6|nr:alpha/beta hydrolase [Nonomuraea basaltis]TMR98375.1 alpha/beta hydrolase [Nonomuraea basaltis]
MSEGESDRHAVIVPGGGYGPLAGLLAYVSEAAGRRGAHLELISWTPPQDRPLVERSSWVHEQVTSVVEKLPVPTPLLIGKSLGSYGAAVAADRGLPAVWLTPLLTMPACVSAMRRATEPFLLVGGTEDGFWDGPLARELTPHVLEVEGAGHGMMVPGPLPRSAEVLGQVLAAVEAFLDEVVWR